MTWSPLQAALKMSTLPGALRATLDGVLDHINPAPEDCTRPETLIVFESLTQLADDFDVARRQLEVVNVAQVARFTDLGCG
jgi:hypothetical protein